jgi:hypothetical protein
MQAAQSPQTTVPMIPLDRVVQARQAIKDARTVKRHAYEQEDAALEEDQHKLDMLLLQLLNGTVIRSLKLKPSAADWGAIWEWMKANDAADLLERRLKTTFIKEFMDANDGAIPPGINVHREYEVSVRRPTNKPASGAPTTDHT